MDIRVESGWRSSRQFCDCWAEVIFVRLTWKKAGWIGESEGGDTLSGLPGNQRSASTGESVRGQRWLEGGGGSVGGPARWRLCRYASSLSPHWKEIHSASRGLLSSLHSFWWVVTFDTTSLTKEALLSRRLKFWSESFSPCLFQSLDEF